MGLARPYRFPVRALPLGLLPVESGPHHLLYRHALVTTPARGAHRKRLNHVHQDPAILRAVHRAGRNRIHPIPVMLRTIHRGGQSRAHWGPAMLPMSHRGEKNLVLRAPALPRTAAAAAHRRRTATCPSNQAPVMVRTPAAVGGAATVISRKERLDTRYRDQEREARRRRGALPGVLMETRGVRG